VWPRPSTSERSERKIMTKRTRFRDSKKSLRAKDEKGGFKRRKEEEQKKGKTLTNSVGAPFSRKLGSLERYP